MGTLSWWLELPSGLSDRESGEVGEGLFIGNVRQYQNG